MGSLLASRPALYPLLILPGKTGRQKANTLTIQRIDANGRCDSARGDWAVMSCQLPLRDATA